MINHKFSFNPVFKLKKKRKVMQNNLLKKQEIFKKYKNYTKSSTCLTSTKLISGALSGAFSAVLPLPKLSILSGPFLPYWSKAIILQK